MKKPPQYRDPAAGWLLENCSKAALVDFAIEQLRLASGECDRQLTEIDAQRAIQGILRVRGDSVAVATADNCEQLGGDK